MKRKTIITTFAFTLMLVLSLSLLSSCNKNKHKFATEWKYDEKSHWHECITKKHTDISEKIAHDFNEGVVTTAPTETEKGVKTLTCKTCGYKKTEPIDTLPHTHKYATDWSTDETNHWHVAICEHTEMKKDVGAHVFTTWTVKTEANYGQNRIEQSNCDVCGFHTEKEIEESMLQPKERTIEIAETFNGFVFDGTHKSIDEFVTVTNEEGGMTIKYRLEGEEEWTTEAPTTVGKYEYFIELKGTIEWAYKDLKSNFTISPYKITLDKDSFEANFGESLPSGVFGLMYEDVSENVNGWTDYATICVPKEYQEAGRWEISVEELFVDDENFVVDYGTFQKVSFVVWDTADFYAGVKDIFQVGSDVIISTEIARGTLTVGDEIYFHEIKKTVNVLKMEAKRNIIQKATVGDEVSIRVSELTKEEISRGYTFSKPNSISDYNRFVVRMKLFSKEEGGRHTPISSGYFPTANFKDTFSTVQSRITLPKGTELMMPGETLDNVAVDFGTQQPGFIGRKFYIMEPGQMIAECEITDVHNHNYPNGSCSCGYYARHTLTIEDGTCQSENLTYLINEKRYFDVTLPGDATEDVTYKIELSESSYSVKIYYTGAVLTPDAEGNIKIPGSLERMEVDVIANKPGRCVLTITRVEQEPVVEPTRLNFDEVTNVATSGQVGYRPNEKKEYVIGLGTTRIQNVTFTFEISNKKDCSITVYNAKGEIVQLIN